MRLFPVRLRRGRSAARDPVAGNGHDIVEEEELVGGEGWLSMHDVRKSYRGQMVVRGVSLAAPAARRWASWAPTAPARPRSST